MTKLLLALCLIFAASPAALANNPPGVQSLSAILLMPLLIIAISLAGGAYPILRKLKPMDASDAQSKIITATLLIIFSVLSEVALVAMVIFTVAAIRRSFDMFAWAKKIPGKFPELTGANRFRLKIGASGLLFVQATLVYTSLFFLCPWHAWYSDHDLLLSFVRYQLRFGSLHQHQGRPFFDHIKVSQIPDAEVIQGYNDSDAIFKVSYGNRDESFVVLIAPNRLPLFPLNLTTSMPSFRADESGKIRMCFVHWNGEVCPADAPLVHVVDAREASLKTDSREARYEERDQSWRRKCKWAHGTVTW